MKAAAAYLLRTVMLSFICLLLATREARAQLVISTGVEEVYDDNIFLENDSGVPPPFVVDSQLGSSNTVIIPPKQVDGTLDDDFITNLYIGFSGPIPLTPYLKSSAEAKVGGIIFADNTDESRMTLDTTLDFQTEKTLLPDPWYAELKNQIQSRANDINSAEGTATRQAQTMVSSLALGVRDVKLAQATKFGLGYTFAYNDFLGDFTFSNSDELDLGPFAARVKIRGSDYITNALDSNLDQTLSEKWTAGLFAGVRNFTFTHVESSDLLPQQTSDLDRTEFSTGVKTSYQISQQVSAGASAGLNYSHLEHRPDDVIFSVISDDGTITQVMRPGKQNDTAFIFGANLNYAPDVTSLLRLAIDQTRSTDVDGSQLITRSVSMDASKGVGDRFKLAAGGKFLQYNIGTTISDPSERYEFTLSAEYSITEALALTAGWNYVNQNVDEKNVTQRLVFASEDYEGNRFFIGLTAGLLGKKS